jgi:Reverse transcriptase (RNA-dependent DNA polymerase)
LPVQLPPAFTSAAFSSLLAGFESTWTKLGNSAPRTIPSKYSVARSSFYRRATAIVNPVGFYFLAKAIDEYWPQIETHYSSSTLSRSVPTFDGVLRAIKLRKFSELHEEQVTSAAGYQYALVTDVGSFFPTIYTHTIPWALHTKEVAKKNQTKIPKYFGNILDGRSMAVQDGQTIGLPIGPDTSHILAEVIAVAIDNCLVTELGMVPAGFRYVDDFFLFFNSLHDADRALAAVTRAVSSFELQLNPAKTRIVDVKGLAAESWKYNIKKLFVSENRRTQRNDIHHYFESIFALEKQFRDESLVKYGLKQISSKIIKKSNWPVFEAYLLKCGFSFPNTLQTIAHIFATYHHYGYPVNKIAVSRFCNSLLASAAAVDHHGEVSWLLWIAKELSLDLTLDAVTAIEEMANPVCTLILLDLCNAGIVTSSPDKSSLRKYAVSESLYGADWILSYEAGRREWLGITQDNFLSQDPYFGPLNAAGVEFYDETAALSPIFELNNALASSDHIDFDSDQAIDKFFTFDDMDEEYSDCAGSEDKNSEDDDDERDGDGDDESDVEF